MKNLKLSAIGLAFLMTAATTVQSCKSKSKETTTDTTNISAPVTVTPEPAPVQISADDSLKTGARDATKDYPGVTADVANGEITLTGEIERSKLQDLMQTLNSLRPKKINNNLKVK
jgi:hypothetical protein